MRKMEKLFYESFKFFQNKIFRAIVKIRTFGKSWNEYLKNNFLFNFSFSFWKNLENFDFSNFSKVHQFQEKMKNSIISRKKASEFVKMHRLNIFQKIKKFFKIFETCFFGWIEKNFLRKNYQEMRKILKLKKYLKSETTTENPHF